MGKKLKAVAVCLIIIGLMGDLIISSSLYNRLSYQLDDLAWVFFFIVGVSVVFDGMLLYAFGEMVEDIHALRTQFVKPEPAVVNESEMEPVKTWWEEQKEAAEATQAPSDDSTENIIDYNLPEL